MKLTDIAIKNSKVIVSRKVEDSMLLVFIDNNTGALLEGITETVWRLINGKRTISEIIKKAPKECSGIYKKKKKYILEAIDDLKKINAIRFKK